MRHRYGRGIYRRHPEYFKRRRRYTGQELDSGVVYVGDSGEEYGFSDFTEFDTGTGLPTGMTFYGNAVDVNTGSELGIGDDDNQVDKYFYWDAKSDFQQRAYGIDFLDSVGFETGEILIRVYVASTPTTGSRHDAGPACWLENPTSDDAGRNWLMGTIFARTVGSDHESGAYALDGTTQSSKVLPADIQVAEVTDKWYWFRMRIEANGANYNFRTKAWRPGIVNEPAGWDAEATNVSWSGNVGGAIGFGQVGTQRFLVNKVAWISVSTDPSATEPPKPGPGRKGYA